MIRLLLDANLSWRSILSLKEHFNECFHVDDIGLKVPAKDMEIWEYARDNNLVIVTNDEDFLNLSVVKGFPPKIILLKTGNQSRKIIEDILIRSKMQLINFEHSEYGVLEIVG